MLQRRSHPSDRRACPQKRYRRPARGSLRSPLARSEASLQSASRLACRRSLRSLLAGRSRSPARLSEALPLVAPPVSRSHIRRPPFGRPPGSRVAHPAVLPGSRFTSFTGRASPCRAPRSLRSREHRSPDRGPPCGRPPGSCVVTPDGRSSRSLVRRRSRWSRRPRRAARLAALPLAHSEASLRSASRLMCRRSFRSLLAAHSAHRSPVRGAPAGRAARLLCRRSLTSILPLAKSAASLRSAARRSCRPGRASRLPLAHPAALPLVAPPGQR